MEGSLYPKFLPGPLLPEGLCGVYGDDALQSRVQCWHAALRPLPLPRLPKSQNHPTQQSCAVSRGLLHIYCTKEHVRIASNIISEAPRTPPDSQLRLGSERGRVTDKLPPLQWETGTGRREEAPDAPRMDAPRVWAAGEGQPPRRKQGGSHL